MEKALYVEEIYRFKEAIAISLASRSNLWPYTFRLQSTLPLIYHRPVSGRTLTFKF